MQRLKQPGSDPCGMPDDDGLKIKPLSLQLPDVHESMRLAGKTDLALDPRQPRSRLLCCCGRPGCSIGPMTQIEEMS